MIFNTLNKTVQLNILLDCSFVSSNKILILTHGYISGGTSINLSLWRGKSAAPLILMHMGYGIGSFIVPLYVYPFLAETMESPLSITANVSVSTNDTLFRQMYNNSYDNHTDVTSEQSLIVIKESTIEYAYAIAAIWLASSSVAFVYYQIQEIRMKDKYVCAEKSVRMLSMPREPKSDTNKKTFLESINPGTCANGDFWYSVKIFALVFIFMGNIGGSERVLGSFLRSFAVDQLNFSNIDSSLLNTSFWTSFSVGRLVFGIIAKWVSIRILFIVETVGVTISVILLNIFAVHNSTALWVLMQFIGFLGAPFWPTGVAITDYHIELTGVGMTVQILGASIGGIVHLRIIGYLYYTYGPKSFLYQLIGSELLSLTICFSILFVGKKHGSRFEKTENQTNDEMIPGIEKWQDEY